VALWRDPEHCTRQLADVARIFSGRPHLASCLTSSTGQGQVEAAMRVIFGGYQMVRNDFSLNAPRYSTFEACREFLPDVAAAAQAANPSGYLGALCVREPGDSGRFEASIWSRL
jgi:hypothetical protein